MSHECGSEGILRAVLCGNTEEALHTACDAWVQGGARTVTCAPRILACPAACILVPLAKIRPGTSRSSVYLDVVAFMPNDFMVCVYVAGGGGCLE